MGMKKRIALVVGSVGLLVGLVAGVAFAMTITGTNRPDNITATNRADNIAASANRDVVNGSGGPDRIFGDGGNDALDGGAGSDHIEGGDGDNVAAAMMATETGSAWSITTRTTSLVVGTAPMTCAW